MRAEHLVCPLVLEFAEQVEVEVAQRRQEAVGVANRYRIARAKENLQPVAEQLASPFHPGLEDPPRMDALHLAPALIIDEPGDARRAGAKRTPPDAIALHVSAENGRRIRMVERDQPLQAVRRLT